MNWQNKRLRNIYIIDNMSTWEVLKLDGYHQYFDLVLTYDLELYKYIESSGGSVEYFDHLFAYDIPLHHSNQTH